MKGSKYKDFNYVKEIAWDLFVRLGRPPSQLDFRKAGHRSVLVYHKLRTIYEAFGWQMRMPTEHWKGLENVKKALLPFYLEHNRIPTAKELILMNLSTMLNYHSIYEIAKIFGVEHQQRPPNFWTDESNAKKEIESVLDKLPGGIMDKAFLATQGMQAALSHYPLNIINSWFSFEYKRKPRGYWVYGNNVLSELKKLPIPPNYLPPHDYLVKNGKSSISYAIGKHHGGFRKFARKYKLQYDGIKFIADCGCIALSHFELFVHNFLYKHNIKHDSDQVISSDSNEKNYRYDIKFEWNDQRYYVELWGNMGRQYKKNKALKKELYKRMSLELIEIEYSIFQNNSYHQFDKYLTDIFNFALPEQTKKNHKIKFDELNKCIIYTFDDLKNDILPLIKENAGKMPSQKILKDHKLDKKVNKFGGINKVAKKLNFKTSRKPPGYWESPKNMETEILKVTGGKYILPINTYLRKNGHFGILSGLKYHGGLLKFGLDNGFEIPSRNSSNQHLVKYNVKIKDGKWADIGYVLTQAKALKSKLGRRPKQKDYQQNGMGGMFTYFTMHTVHKKLDWPIRRLPNK